MKSSTRLTSCKTILFINIIFWSILATIYATTSNPYYYGFMEYLLFLEPVFFLGALIGVHAKRPVIYLLSLAFTLINAILSVTDEIGTLDLIAAILSALAFASLLLIRKEILSSIEVKTKSGIQNSTSIIATCADIIEAKRIEAILSSKGIPCFIDEGAAKLNPLLVGAIGWIKISVPEKDAKRAKELLS